MTEEAGSRRAEAAPTISDTIYILGTGAVGLPLGVFLAEAGRKVVAVHTSRRDVEPTAVRATVRGGDYAMTAALDTVSLDRLAVLDGMIVVAAKSYANPAIADALAARRARGPIVILQNGVGVERPFVEARLGSVYRCVLYVTGQSAAPLDVTFRPVSSSPIGPIHGDEVSADEVVSVLSTQRFPFHPDADIEREVWKKAIINAVFNSVCPLLGVDNGIFRREPGVARLAEEIVEECVALTRRLGLSLTSRELVEQLQLISTRSDGQLISTLQDIRAGRPTEIDALNLEIARTGAALRPPVALPRTELLGRLTLALSELSRSSRQ